MLNFFLNKEKFGREINFSLGKKFIFSTENLIVNLSFEPKDELVVNFDNVVFFYNYEKEFNSPSFLRNLKASIKPKFKYKLVINIDEDHNNSYISFYNEGRWVKLNREWIVSLIKNEKDSRKEYWNFDLNSLTISEIINNILLTLEKFTFFEYWTSINTEFGFYTHTSKIVSDVPFETFHKKIKEIETNKKFKNIPITSFKKISDDEFILKSNKNILNIKLNKENNKILIDSEGIDLDRLQSSKFSTSILENLYFYLNDVTYVTTVPKLKISKRQIIFSLIGVVIFSIFVWLLFNKIYDISNMTQAFKNISLGMKTPWPYLMVFDALSTYVVVIFTTIVVDLIDGKKVSGDKIYITLKYRLLRINVIALVRTFTGNWLLAITIWTWIDNTRKVKVGQVRERTSSTIVKVGSSLTVITIFGLIFGVIKLSIGTWQMFLYQSLGLDVVVPYWTFVVSGWIGWLFSGLHVFIFFAIVYIKSINKYIFWFVNFILFTIFRTESYYKINNRIESSILNIRKEANFKKFIKLFDKRRTIMWGSAALLSVFEPIYHINLVLYVNNLSNFTVSNPFPLLGVESIIYYTKEIFPIPGGIGIDEIVRSQAYNGFLNFYLPAGALNVLDVGDLAMQATFTRQLFNSYIPGILSIFVGGYAITNAIYLSSKMK